MSAAAELDDVINAKMLRFFPDLVAELGGDAALLLREAGLDPGLGLIGDSLVAYGSMGELLEIAADRLACPDFGLRLAVRQGGAMFGPLGQVMRNASSFGEALEYVSRHAFAHSFAAAIWLRPGEPGDLVFAGHDILLDRMQAKAQLLEQILLLGHLGATEITGGHVHARRVHFRHRPVSPLRTYRRHFRCEVRFGQDEDGIFFSPEDLARPVITHDAAAYRLAAGYIKEVFTRRPPLHAQVRAVILQRLIREPCSNGHIAAALNLHPRTLHRRLQTQGASFQQIKDEVRRDLLRFYLEETEFDLTTISAKLGFAEQSVMTRCCQAWFSLSPTRLRIRAREADRRLRVGAALS